MQNTTSRESSILPTLLQRTKESITKGQEHHNSTIEQQTRKCKAKATSHHIMTTTSLSSVSEALSSPPSFMSSSVSIPDHASIQCADSKFGETDSVVSPTSVKCDFSSRSDNSQDLSRLQQLEQKRLALRSQRFNLEQRLYEFCGKHAEDGPVVESPLNKPTRYVLDFEYQQAGVKCRYSGPLNEQDEPHGSNGILRFLDGQVYRGDLKDGQRWGGGSNSWTDRQEYTGEWKANSRNGRGTHTWPDGRKVAGQWKEGHLHGKVYFSWPNGATFDGTCKMGKKDGRGECARGGRGVYYLVANTSLSHFE